MVSVAISPSKCWTVHGRSIIQQSDIGKEHGHYKRILTDDAIVEKQQLTVLSWFHGLVAKWKKASFDSHSFMSIVKSVVWLSRERFHGADSRNYADTVGKLRGFSTLGRFRGVLQLLEISVPWLETGVVRLHE